MSVVLVALGFFTLYPILLLLIYSFNVAAHIFITPAEWGLGNWRAAFGEPGVLRSLFNSILIWALTAGISLPIAIAISWVLARTRIPWSNGLEFMFWVSFMVPTLASTIGWIMLMDPRIGLFNQLILKLPFVSEAPFNIFSVGGIVWANLMAHGICLKVMILTPAFRNMNGALEEAGRISGASSLRTMLRITLPLMVPMIVLVFALQLLRVFQSFETEQLLGRPFGFYVYSTKIYQLVSGGEQLPRYGQAIVLASITLAIIALIIPLQRWILNRRQYTTVTSGFRLGLTDLGRWKYVVVSVMWLLITLLTIAPIAALVLGSFMTRAGFFEFQPAFTLNNWRLVLTNGQFLRALQTTLTLGIASAVISPLLFSMIAYILVRTTWTGRLALDWIVWGSGAIPGILSGLGLLLLFLTTPGLSSLFGSIWALVLVMLLDGRTTGVNVMKGTLVQIGKEMEEAARISGAGWVKTYIFIWIPLTMRTMILLSILNFVHAVSATSSVILLASRDTLTLSILALNFRQGANQEAASIVSIILLVLTLGVAIIIRTFGLRAAVQVDS